ncbi:MAG: hypothetical protein J1F43_03105 [Muribaculaceae bacterium]|nr:hypothetical protein [Muribaculaceae bacterium]
MEESYEEIVRKWYKKLRPNFIDNLMEKYKGSKMRLEDAENIYQDVFIAIYDNIAKGAIRDNTSWSSYIMTIGLNMATKKYRGLSKSVSINEKGSEEEDSPENLAREVVKEIQKLSEEDQELYSDPEAQALLGEELIHTPEPCASIIRYTYFSGLKDKEITEELDKYNSAQAVKAKRYQCMKDLIYRVKLSLFHAGLIDTKPERR